MRVKGGFTNRRRHKKVLKRASGYRNAGGRCYTHAVEMNDRGMVFAYRDRKVHKREMRSLWTVRINAAARMNGTTYSRLMGALAKSKIALDRKALAELALNDAAAFSQIVKQVLG
ncbi:MAG: 50S ribosomal protein L20 [Bdellovibrionales bacterium]|nr:50S ribosomal protein L20 [Bdellovibrionales bacterium]